MKKIFDSKKLDWCKDELKVLLKKLLEGNYEQTAKVVFDHVAHTGVETDLNPELKNKPTLEEFLKSEQLKIYPRMVIIRLEHKPL